MLRFLVDMKILFHYNKGEKKNNETCVERAGKGV